MTTGAARRDPYAVLGVGRGASADEVKAAYRRQARVHHPDAGGDEVAFVEVLEAYSALSDPARRAEADAAACAPEAGWGEGEAAAADADPLSWDEMLEGLGGWPDAPSFARDGAATPTYVTLRVGADEAAAGFRKRMTVSVPGRPAKVRVEVSCEPGGAPGFDVSFPGMGKPAPAGFADLVVRVRLSRRARAGAGGRV